MQHCIIPQAFGTDCSSLTTGQSQVLWRMLCGMNQFVLRTCTAELSQYSDGAADWMAGNSGFYSQEGGRTCFLFFVRLVDLLGFTPEVKRPSIEADLMSV